MSSTWLREQPGNVFSRRSSKPEGKRTVCEFKTNFLYTKYPLMSSLKVWGDNTLDPFCADHLFSLQVQEEFIKEVRVSKSTEKIHELETKGAFYKRKWKRFSTGSRNTALIINQLFSIVLFSTCLGTFSIWIYRTPSRWIHLGACLHASQVQDSGCCRARTERSHLHDATWIH